MAAGSVLRCWWHGGALYRHFGAPTLLGRLGDGGSGDGLLGHPTTRVHWTLGRNRGDRGNWGYISDRTLQGFTKGNMKGYNFGSSSQIGRCGQESLKFKHQILEQGERRLVD